MFFILILFLLLSESYGEDSGGPWRTERRGEGQQEGEKEVQKQTRGPRRNPKRPPRTTWRPPKLHKRPPRGAIKSRRGPENALNTIFGGEHLIYAKCSFPIVKPRFSRLGGSIWELNIDTKRLQEDSGGPWRTERRAERQEEEEKEAQQEEKHSPEALRDIDPASTQRRPSCGPLSGLVIFAVDVVP